MDQNSFRIYFAACSIERLTKSSPKENDFSHKLTAERYYIKKKKNETNLNNKCVRILSLVLYMDEWKEHSSKIFDMYVYLYVLVVRYFLLDDAKK